MNLLASGIASMHDDLAAYAAEAVVFVQPGAAEVPKGTPPADLRIETSALVGRTIFRQVASSGVDIRTETRDFVFRAADLAVEPRRGDRVEWGGRKWEVWGAGGEPAWRWSDPQHAALRVHTKIVLGGRQQ